MRQEQIDTIGFAHGDRRCKVNGIQCSNDRWKRFARPLHDSFIQGVYCQCVLNCLYLSNQGGYLHVSNFVHQPKTVYGP